MFFSFNLLFCKSILMLSGKLYVKSLFFTLFLMSLPATEVQTWKKLMRMGSYNSGDSIQWINVFIWTQAQLTMWIH